MSNTYKIAIVSDHPKEWYKKFITAIQKKISEGYKIEFQLLNLDTSDWIAKVKPFDIILWRPSYMGVDYASHFKEKIYFLENILYKKVIPNYASVWPFESKVAQHYLFEYFNIPTPNTFVSFDFKESHESLNQFELPIIYKKSAGAASKYVKLIKNLKQIQKIVFSEFNRSIWINKRENESYIPRLILKNFYKPWFWAKARDIVFDRKNYGNIYLQEFLPNNNQDLRIVVIGDLFVYWFWRNNRRNDFRASGSGDVDFQKKLPLEVLHYCRQLNQQLNFNTMSYDILFKDNEFKIVEMSCSYPDPTLYKTGRFYSFEDEEVKLIMRNTWPEELWIEWIIKKYNIPKVKP